MEDKEYNPVNPFQAEGLALRSKVVFTYPRNSMAETVALHIGFFSDGILLGGDSSRKILLQGAEKTADVIADAVRKEAVKFLYKYIYGEELPAYEK